MWRSRRKSFSALKKQPRFDRSSGSLFQPSDAFFNRRVSGEQAQQASAMAGDFQGLEGRMLASLDGGGLRFIKPLQTPQRVNRIFTSCQVGATGVRPEFPPAGVGGLAAALTRN